MSSGKVASYDDSSGAGLFGALVGFAVGGPIGAIIGGALASGTGSSSSYSSSYSRSSYYNHDYEAQRHRERERQENKRILREQQQREREEARQRKLEAERQRKLKEERKRMIANSWRQIQSELKRQVKSIKSEPEREKLLGSITSLEKPYIETMNGNDTYKAENIVNRLRQEIISMQAEEELILSRQGKLSEFLSALSKNAHAGFTEEINAIRKKNTISASNSVDEQNKRIKLLFTEAQNLAGEISRANSISLEGITEQTFIILPVVPRVNESKSSESVELLQDICDFGGRVAFYDEDTADSLKPLITEAKDCKEISRLKLIRSQIKTTYNHLREQAVLTAMFKRDFKDFLPSMRRLQNTESLCLRMEELLTAPIISRDDYNKIYKEVKAVFTEHFDDIIEAAFAEKISETLAGMGYTLFDENGRPAALTPGQLRVIDAPYEGYRVRVKVGRDKSLVTRLVRVVGSEEEKTSVSEYQKQQDIETGQKWREKVMGLYNVLRDEGIPMKIVHSKEPGEEPLDVVVDTSFKKSIQREISAELHTENLQTRKIGE